MFKSNNWSQRLLTVRAALRLSDLIVGVENVTSVSDKVSSIPQEEFSVSEVCLKFP